MWLISCEEFPPPREKCCRNELAFEDCSAPRVPLTDMEERKIRILFADDEPGIRMTLPLILEQEGFEVSVAATVAEALVYINRDSFDVLLADLNIGEKGDGFTLISAMRRVQPHAVTLILTGYPDFVTALEAIRNQVDDYLTK